MLEGAGIGAYSYTEYRVATRESTKTPASTITAHVDAALVDDSTVARASAVVTAIHQVRDLVNMPPSELYPETLAAAAVDLAEGLPVEVEVLDVAALEAGGFGGILGVGLGSSRGPRLAVVRYSPAGAAQHLALVGKGITFDSGGLSLKPAASMVGMKYDMTGAATVLAVTLAAARLRLPVRITAWMCIAENLPSGTAARPNDVLRIRGGKTVEVLNTDAEGRLVLADGLVAASEEHPDAIVDVATLTGGARVAMGERYVPVMGDDQLIARAIALGAAVGEPIWHMPLPPELRGVLDSDVADIANARPGNPNGGMLVAAHFLKYFVGAERRDRRYPADPLDAPRHRRSRQQCRGPARRFRKGADRSHRAHPDRLGRRFFATIVGSLWQGIPCLCMCRAPPMSGTDRVLSHEGVAGCPSRILTLSCWAPGVAAMPLRCARPSWVCPSV